MMTIKKKYQQPAIEEISLDMESLSLLTGSTEVIEIDETTIENIENQD